jgi:hypothetical protein
MTLSVLAPTSITTAMLTSSSLAENDYAAWASGTAYAVGGFCISAITHRVYQCLAACTGKDPTDLNNQFGPVAYWLDYGPTNAWAMFDGEVSSQTSSASAITVVLQPGAFNAIYLAGLSSTTVTFTVKDQAGGSVVYNQTFSLEGSAPADYYNYFYDPFKPLSDLLVTGIVPYASAELTMVLSAGKCGLMAVGSIKALGDTQYGAKAKPKTFSYITTDAFGNTKIVRRKKATDMSATAWLKLSDANFVLQTIRSLLDVPAVWIGSDLTDYGGLRCFGLGSGEISYDYPEDCQLTLSVQGLI